MPYDRTTSPTIAIIPSTATIPVSKENLNPSPAHSATRSNNTSLHPRSLTWTRARIVIVMPRVAPLGRRIIGSNRGPYYPLPQARPRAVQVLLLGVQAELEGLERIDNCPELGKGLSLRPLMMAIIPTETGKMWNSRELGRGLSRLFSTATIPTEPERMWKL